MASFTSCGRLILVACALIVSTSCGGDSPTSPSASTPSPASPGPSQTPAIAVSQVEVETTSFAGGKEVTGTIKLTGPAPANGSAVQISSSDAAATVPASVTIPAGASSGTFMIATRTVVSDTPVTISASLGADKRETTISVNSLGELHSLSLGSGSQSAMYIGHTLPTYGVAMLKAPVSEPTIVKLTTSDPAVAEPGSLIQFAPGETRANFQVVGRNVPDDSAVTISARAGGETRSISFTVVGGPFGVTITSEAGEYIGQGRTFRAPANARIWTASMCDGRGVRIEVESGFDQWVISVFGPQGSSLKPGTYDVPSSSAYPMPTLSVSNGSKSCPGQGYGRFTVDKVDLTGGTVGSVRRFRGVVEHACAGRGGLLRAEISIGAGLQRNVGGQCP